MLGLERLRREAMVWAYRSNHASDYAETVWMIEHLTDAGWVEMSVYIKRFDDRKLVLKHFREYSQEREEYGPFRLRLRDITHLERVRLRQYWGK
jgi:hypothetical protein